METTCAKCEKQVDRVWYVWTKNQYYCDECFYEYIQECSLKEKTEKQEREMSKKSTLKIRLTERNFAYAEFDDLYGSHCSIQESSLATECAIWLGEKEHRMHLSQEQVKALLPLLKKFVKTGCIAKYDDRFRL